MAILETTQLSSVEAADGRFFDSEILTTGTDLYRSSVDFWATYCDVLPTAHGLIIQADLAINPVTLLPQEGAVTATSLFFDATKHEQSEYGWHMVTAVPGWGRTAHQVTVRPNGDEQRSAYFDAQGRLMGRVDVEQDALATLIEQLSQHENVMKTAHVAREARLANQRELAAFTVEAVHRFAPARFDKEVKHRQDRINAAGFSASTPFAW